MEEIHLATLNIFQKSGKLLELSLRLEALESPTCYFPLTLTVRTVEVSRHTGQPARAAPTCPRPLAHISSNFPPQAAPEWHGLCPTHTLHPLQLQRSCKVAPVQCTLGPSQPTPDPAIPLMWTQHSTPWDPPAHAYSRSSQPAKSTRYMKSLQGMLLYKATSPRMGEVAMLPNS